MSDIKTQGSIPSDLLNALTDEQLADEIHQRRLNKRNFQQHQYESFAKSLLGVLDEFEKITGKRIENRGYGYRTVEKK